MNLWERWKRAARGLESTGNGEPPAPPPLPQEEEDDDAPEPEDAELDDPDAPPGTRRRRGPRGIASWLEQRAHRAVSQAYQTHAADLEERAHRAIRSLYEQSADDIEQRAVRAMRRAIEAEAKRIEQAIERAIAVKKREVRLSLLVLVVSSLVYLALYWLTTRPP